MRKSIVKQSMIIFVLVILLGLLNIPKYNQVSPLIMESLVLAGFETINLKPYTILLIILILEIITSLINMAILNWIYKMSDLNYTLPTNAIIYLISSCISKLLSLIVPLSILSTMALLPNLIFGIIFMMLHFYLNTALNFKQKSWLSGFVIVNILLAIL